MNSIDIVRVLNKSPDLGHIVKNNHSNPLYKIYIESLMSNTKATLALVVAIAAALVMVISPALTSSALANVKGSTDTSCSNGGGQTVADKTSCPSSPPQTQNTCAATTGNGKCPSGQN
jgi:hypothetical protein